MDICRVRCPGALPRCAETVVVVILCFALLSCCVLSPACAVGTGATVAVGGGALGTGGLAGVAALGGALMPTLGVIGVVLLGCGVNAYVTEASADRGLTRAQFLESSLRSWVSERGGSFDDLISTIAEGIHVSPLGQIALTGAAGALIYQFGNWLFANDLVSDSVSSGTITIDGFPFIADSGSYYYTYYYSNSNITEHKKIEYECSGTQPVYMVIQNNNVIFVSSASATVTKKSYDNVISNPGSYTIRTLNVTMPFGGHNSYIYEDQFFNPGLGSGYTSVYDNTIPVYTGTTNIYQHFKNNTVDWSGSGSGTPALPSDDVFTGSEQDWTANRDLLKPGTGEDIVVSGAPDLIGGLSSLLGAGDYTISVPDYLTAIQQAYEDALTAEASISVTVTNELTGVVSQASVTVPDVLEDAGLQNAAVSTDATGALVAPGAAVDAGQAVQLLTPDLTTIFPFCIPFDLARVLTLLAADPVTPQYHVSWDAAYLPEPIEFDIDLTPWNGVAAVLRTMETLASVVGLAIITRRVYLRG